MTYNCSTDAGATWSACTSPATFNNLSTGSHTFEVTVSDGHGNTSDPASSSSWTVVDLSISLSPPTATDDAATSSPTLTTCTINQDTGGGPVAAFGATCNWSVTGSGPNGGVKSGFCTTGVTGTCTFSYTDSGGTGTDTIHATTTFSVSGLSMTRATGDGIRSDGSDVSKTWVDAYVTISPASATNEAGTNHDLTISVYTDDGSGGVPVLTGGVVSDREFAQRHGLFDVRGWTPVRRRRVAQGRAPVR